MVGNYFRNSSVFLQYYSSEWEFPLLLLKSMENVSCHSKKSYYPIGTKSRIYVEAYVINLHEAYQLFPLYIPLQFQREDVYNKLPFVSPWQPITFSDLDKIHMESKALLNKHLCKRSKYP